MSVQSGIVRPDSVSTFGIGADKQVEYFNLGKEDNPAMGYRAIRICLKEQDIFCTQLRALLRAAVYDNLSIMYPMIISVEDVKKIYEILEGVKKELDDFYNPHHKAILRMIQMVVENAHKEEKWVGICGELEADLELTKEFIDMGVDELSVAPSMILPLRKTVREI